MNGNTYVSEEAAELRLLRPGTGPVSTLQDYWELVKPEITFQVVLAALAGFILGSSAGLNLLQLILTLSGTALASAGGAVLNHYVERDNDALMRRTAQRPLPSGRISPGAALVFGVLLVTGGLALLWWVNIITLLLAALTILLYLFAYTPLKRRTTYNTLIGNNSGSTAGFGRLYGSNRDVWHWWMDSLWHVCTLASSALSGSCVDVPQRLCTWRPCDAPCKKPGRKSYSSPHPGL